MTTWRRFHICMSIEGFLSNNRYPKDFNIFQHDNGTEMSPDEALAYLVTEKAKGHTVIPCSAECGNPCKQAGCKGFDFTGDGCPGYEITDKEQA